MTTVITFRKNAPQGSLVDQSDKDSSTVKVANDDSPPLGSPRGERRYFWHKKVPFDPDAIATQVRYFQMQVLSAQADTHYQPSVYDDAEQAEQFKPRDDW